MCKEHIFTTLDRERDQIRLVYLDKSRHTVSSAATTLAGRLETMPLSEAPQYNALSYVWGSPTAVSSVCLDDGSSIPIGANLLDALAHVAIINSVRLSLPRTIEDKAYQILVTDMGRCCLYRSGQ